MGISLGVKRAWHIIKVWVAACLVLLPSGLRRHFPAVSNPAVVRREEDTDSPHAHHGKVTYPSATDAAAAARPPAPNLAAAADDGFSLAERASAAARNAWSWARARLNMAASQRQLQQGSEIDYVPRPPEKDPPA